MQDGVVTVVIECRAQPGRGTVLRKELAALAHTVVATEPDCLGIEMLQGEDDDTRILMYERWTSREAYTGPHMQTPHITAFFDRAPDFSAGPPTITFWRSVENIVRA
jgi:quinol monooxygenase YgiN